MTLAKIAAMPASPSSSAQAARQRLGGRLRQMRVDRGITGVRFAAEAGWRDSSLVSMIERGRRTISADHVRLWCRICGASPRLTAELLAEQAAVAGMWVTYREANRGGLRLVQESVRDDYQRVRVHRVYQTKVIPGLLQTRAITTAYLEQARREQHLELDDVAEAVEERMRRQACLRRPDARWLFVVEEAVLRFRPAPVEIHADQLRHLLAMMSWPTVVFGVIPQDADRVGVCPEESFSAFDSRMVSVELVSGYLTVTQPYEIRMYMEAWERLFGLAVVGTRASALIMAALQALDPQGGVE
ncbi:transcriptional regulator [Actinomadura craniellae]|uniref:Transcriptional regulator n=1 Tax=Actinomadura craniellae TaxID=2231787 RepID=A0A365H5Z6_9ACTN|nr:helix-turn-helix transcriptional regulator [Actinomadura craniellae]RAY14469.1 transcriptional regulator [Actinomadura craniellae]